MKPRNPFENGKAPYLGSKEEVVEHESKYHGMWWDKGNLFWFVSLLEEFCELGLSLLRLHRHAPEYELKQIASISIGWMDYIRWKQTVVTFERHLPRDWWLHPLFYTELDVPFAQICFLYWQMIWQWDDYQAPLWERKIEKFFGIHFLPD